MSEILQQALLAGWVLDGQGGARALRVADLTGGVAGTGRPLWLHLKRDVPGLRDWLQSQAGVPEDICDALLAEDTRPRCDFYRDGVLLNLRGINRNPDQDPDDMISLRMWVAGDVMISLRKSSMMAASEVWAQLEQGRGPKNTGQLVTFLADSLTEHMLPYLESLDQALDELEDFDPEVPLSRRFQEIARLRASMVVLRRFIAPQMVALGRLTAQASDWFSTQDLIALRNTLDLVTRHVEELDAMRDRASIIRDTLAQTVSERMNRNMYLLSVVAGIFLPLGLITGLLGINVAGMPGTENGNAFWLVCAGLVILALIEWLIFRRIRLL